MTDKLSRRQLLATVGSAGVISLAGCLNPNNSSSPLFGDDNIDEPEPTDVISNLTLKIAPSSRSDPYFVAVSDDLMSGDLSLFNRQQVRVTRQNDIPGEDMRDFIFTVTNDPDYTSDEEETVWVSKEGINRMDGYDGTIVELKAFAASPLFDTRQEAEDNNELIEQYIESSSEVLFIAPEGGELKKNTELQALRGSSESNFSSWSLIGYGSDPTWAHRKWYTPPGMYSLKSFYGLYSLDPPFEQVVSFTGFEEETEKQKRRIVIGGLASDELKEDIKEELEKTFLGAGETENPPVNPDVVITINYSGDNSGSDPNHIANKLSEESTGGVILTQGSLVRNNHWKAVTDSVMTAVD